MNSPTLNHTPTAYTVPLRELTRDRVAEAGRKAANLGDLARARPGWDVMENSTFMRLYF